LTVRHWVVDLEGIMHGNHLHPVLVEDAWLQQMQHLVGQLESEQLGQLAFWPVDDFLERKRFVPCPERGAHTKITDCWLCHGDWVYGHASLAELLSPAADA
jgi:hypothetical protein